MVFLPKKIILQLWSHRCTETQLLGVFNQSCRQTKMLTFWKKLMIDMISDACRDGILSAL